MKTAVSIPDEVFHQADRVAERLGWSRSQLYAQALREFLDQQDEDPVTAALDALADEFGTEPPASVARDLIDTEAWTW